MNTPVRGIRALVVLAALVLVAGPNTQAFATISNPTRDKTMLVGTDVVGPVMAGVRSEADSKSKLPLIRVAPGCPSGCFHFYGG